MLIELESVYGDKLIHGGHFEREELQNAINELLQTVTEKDFLFAFCTHYGYEELPYTGTTYVDYVIDLDTHLLIKPKYK